MAINKLEKFTKNNLKSALALSLVVSLTSFYCYLPAQAQMKLDINSELEAKESSSASGETSDTDDSSTKEVESSESDTENSTTASDGDTKTKTVSDDSKGQTDTEDSDDEVAFSRYQVPRSRTLEMLRDIDSKRQPLLKGKVSTLTGSGRIPILSGTSQKIPAKTEINLVVPQGVILDSEYSQIGDEVFLRIGKDVKSKDGKKILLPGEWFVRGLVTRATGRKRLNRDGILEVQFDKLISPDNQYEIPIDAKFSSKEKKLKTVAKIVAKDSVYMGIGAAAGSLLAYQWGGLGLAISTYGISIGGGAAIGAGIGLIAAKKKKGNIASFREGYVIKLKTDEGLVLPEFDPEALPSAKVKTKLAGLGVVVDKYKFKKVPWKDKHSRLLELQLSVNNDSTKVFHFFDLAVEDDYHRKYRPFFRTKSVHIAPGETGSGKIVFLVGSPKRKYTLLFYSRRNNSELTSVSIN